MKKKISEVGPRQLLQHRLELFARKASDFCNRKGTGLQFSDYLLLKELQRKAYEQGRKDGKKGLLHAQENQS